MRGGESLSTIAARYGTDVNSLAAANGIHPSFVVSPGMTLLLPQRAAQPQATQTLPQTPQSPLRPTSPSPSVAGAAAVTARPTSSSVSSPTTTTSGSGTSAAAAAYLRPNATATRTPSSVHISQFRNRYNPNGPAMAPNCGPASVAMALRLIGLDVPGFQGQKDQRVLDTARIIGTGKNDTSVGTTDSELEKVVNAAGGRWTESTNLDQMLGWAKSGVPVILAGNPSQAWNKRFPANQVYPYNGGHWVTVSGYNSQTGNYVVNDPLSAVGPIEVSQAELQQYFSKDGGLGIAVYR